MSHYLVSWPSTVLRHRNFFVRVPHLRGRRPYLIFPFARPRQSWCSLIPCKIHSKNQPTTASASGYNTLNHNFPFIPFSHFMDLNTLINRLFLNRFNIFFMHITRILYSVRISNSFLVYLLMKASALFSYICFNSICYK